MVTRDTPEWESHSSIVPNWHSPGVDVLPIVDGDGATIVDADGTEYLDFASQLGCTNAGHSNEAIVESMKAQLDRIPYVASLHHNDARSALGTRMREITPDPLDDVFFSVTGSEAIETAVQFVRQYQEAPKVLSRWRSYHGWTYGAGGLTGDPETREFQAHASTTGNVKFLPPMAYRSPFDAETPAELADRAADHLEFVIHNEGPDSIAAILTEPIAGSSGAFAAPPGYLQRVRELCDEYDILLIYDEILTGFGRCGEWFGMEIDGVVPDVMTFAKGVTSAYAPLSGVMVTGEIGEFLREEGVSVGGTYAGYPVGCAAGVAAIDEYGNGLLDTVRELESDLGDRLRDLEAKHDAVGDVRGRGFLWAVEFTDPETGEPFYDPRTDDGDNPVMAVYGEALENGTMFLGGHPRFQLLAAPPFCIDADDVERAIRDLDDAIATVFG